MNQEWRILTINMVPLYSWIKDVLPQSILGVLVRLEKPKIFQDLVTVQRSREGPA